MHGEGIGFRQAGCTLLMAFDAGGMHGMAEGQKEKRQRVTQAGHGRYIVGEAVEDCKGAARRVPTQVLQGSSVVKSGFSGSTDLLKCRTSG